MSTITIVSIEHTRKTYIYEDGVLDSRDNLLDCVVDVENGEVCPDDWETLSEDVVSITVD